MLRVLDFRQASVTYDFLTRSGSQPEASLDLGDASAVRGLIEALVVLVLLMPLPTTVLVLRLLRQGRIRRSAKLLPAADPTAVARRILALAAVAVATVIAKVLLHTARVAGDPARPWTVRLVGLEIVLDLPVLALMATIAFTTVAWTREQDQLEQGRG